MVLPWGAPWQKEFTIKIIIILKCGLHQYPVLNA